MMSLLASTERHALALSWRQWLSTLGVPQVAGKNSHSLYLPATYIHYQGTRTCSITNCPIFFKSHTSTLAPNFPNKTKQNKISHPQLPSHPTFRFYFHSSFLLLSFPKRKVSYSFPGPVTRSVFWAYPCPPLLRCFISSWVFSIQTINQ